jgi:hypothetical protein
LVIFFQIGLGRVPGAGGVLGAGGVPGGGGDSIEGEWLVGGSKRVIY